MTLHEKRLAAKRVALESRVMVLAEEFARLWMIDRDWEEAAENLAYAVNERRNFAEWHEPNVVAPYSQRNADVFAALCALGVRGNGYCFCSHNRDPDKADHQGECADARAAIAAVALAK